VPQDLPAHFGRMVGREAELSRLGDLVGTAPVRGRVQVILGDAGMGKTMLLATVADRARSAGWRVLWATGREPEPSLAYSGLRQLLSPVLGAAAGLPPRQARTLLAALGLTPEPDAADRLVTGIAALTLLSGVSWAAPVLAVIDDAHWLDRGSLDALAFVSTRLGTGRVVLLLGAQGPEPPTGFDQDVPELRLEPLPAEAAGQLLDAQPRPPRGRARAQVLAPAAGNPLALVEMARVIADDPTAGRRWATQPLPPGDRLTAVITARLATMPAAARSALLLAAVADGTGLPAGSAVIPRPDAGALAPAEQLGLITIGTTGPRFSHALVRSAVYQAASLSERAAAHRQIAGAVDDQPDRQAWHLAAAALQPDERVASLLEAAADRAQHRGGMAAAALAMERAAELSPAPQDQARRLVCAASAAATAGRADRVQDLTARALVIATEPEIRLRARSIAGWALAHSGRRSAAIAALLSVAERASADQSALAWQALADAATVACQAGASASRNAVSRVLRLLEGREPPPLAGRGPHAGPPGQKAWILACSGPAGSAGQLVPYLRQQAAGSMDEAGLLRMGAAAWLVDESDLAIRMLQDAMDQLRARGGPESSGGALTALGWLYFDTGRWEQALEAAAQAADLAEANQIGTVAAAADVITATVLAMRGESGPARRHAGRALAAGGATENGLIVARARRALGVAALAGDDQFAAFTQLRQLFSEQGAPVHNIFSYLGVADLAAAAVRADRRSEGHRIIEGALRRLNGAASPRLKQLITTSRAILADPESAGAHLASELADPAGVQWPFERAQLRLVYGEWLRRRRINEARPELALALQTFRRLGAVPWIRRTEAELRATGVAVPGAPDASASLADLTP
jgi:tetratricopeptide (TPR) repeat protein